MRRKINKTGLCLWIIFIVGLIGCAIGLHNGYTFMDKMPPSLHNTWIMLNTDFLATFWPFLVGNAASFISGSFIFVYHFCILFEEDYSPEEVKKVQDLMESKGFTFEQALSVTQQEKKELQQ